MKVVIDATAVPVDRGGVGRYVDALLPALVGAGVDLVVVCQPRDQELLTALVPAADVVAAPASTGRRPARLVWEQVGLPRLVRRLGADLLLSPHYTMPVRAGVPVVVTLHDATFFSHPELHSRVKRVFFRRAIRYAVRHAAALVVPSQATADEVRRFTGAASAKFHVAYHGVDTTVFHPVDDVERARVCATLGVGDLPYVAFLGTLEPRKNVPALVRGWAAAVTGLEPPPALVLAGGPGWDTRVGPAVESVPAGLTVRRTGYLPLEDLPGFLSGAVVVAYPSLGEGFGLPVLEAMACGAAVLTTRELSLPEVGGDAVAYCGTDADSIGAELHALLLDDARRAELATAARARAAGFTWAAAAREHVEAFRAALGRPPGGVPDRPAP
ncbi:glycosyltransferase family 4 protein [Cellulomonas fengjieae]|uniref:glycosyltransferase family 4 protein n=1 Tax=Cellulomonas fengjieae TaxID=2819978 RepID=UPI001AAE1A7A|nr:glycosyltransferase family 1 protein [Cellulomonas fengjieae]MBO3101396.1 glycosyltransferase family 4 protein [Cellulomonas fengjieae]